MAIEHTRRGVSLNAQTTRESPQIDRGQSSGHEDPDLARAVLLNATDEDRRRIERLIRTAGFDSVKVGGIEHSDRLELGGDLHDLASAPHRTSSGSSDGP